MERIPEFNFPHFKPEIHNDKARDQRVGGKTTNKTHCTDFKKIQIYKKTKIQKEKHGSRSEGRGKDNQQDEL